MTELLRDGHGHTRYGRHMFDALKALAIDNARGRLASPAVAVLTDSSTGTAIGTGVIPLLSLPGSYVSEETDRAPKAGFDTAVDKSYDALVVIATWLNLERAKLGLTAITVTGSPATAGTIPAQDKTLTAVASNCVDYATGHAQLSRLRDNLARLILAANEVVSAIGMPGLIDDTRGSLGGNPYTLVQEAATGDAVTGADEDNLTIAKATADAFLTAYANAIATLAVRLNAAVDLDPLPPLSFVYTGGARNIDGPHPLD